MVQKLEISDRESFANIANVILEQKKQNMQEQSLNNIKHILEPFKVDLTNFKQLIHTFENQRIQQHTSLEMQIRNMQNMNQGMIHTAENLTKALKGDSKVQGNWGEMIVKKILDSAGLIEGQHYTEQGRGLDIKDELGKIQRPDFIVNFPNKKPLSLHP